MHCLDKFLIVNTLFHFVWASFSLDHRRASDAGLWLPLRPSRWLSAGIGVANSCSGSRYAETEPPAYYLFGPPARPLAEQNRSRPNGTGERLSRMNLRLQMPPIRAESHLDGRIDSHRPRSAAELAHRCSWRRLPEPLKLLQESFGLLQRFPIGDPRGL